MLDIRTCIKERENHILYNARQDEWIDAINSSELQDEVFFITTEEFLFLQNDEQRDTLFERYYLAGVFDLGALYTSVGSRMALVHVVSEKIWKVKMAVYNESVYDKKKYKSDVSRLGFISPGEYFQQFNDYIKKLEDWVNKEVFPKPTSEGLGEFNTVPVKDIDKNKIYPAYYTKKAMEVRELAQKENFVKLSDVADILMSGAIKGCDEMVKILRPADLSYPLDVNSLSEGTPTKVVLQKGDIVFPRVGSKGAYLYNIDDEEAVYASPSEAVIRCKDISPEYMYFYLKSDVATYLCNMIRQGSYIKNISVKDLSELPIAKPKTNSDALYAVGFKLVSYREKDYTQFRLFNRLWTYKSHCKDMSAEKAESIKSDENTIYDFGRHEDIGMVAEVCGYDSEYYSESEDTKHKSIEDLIDISCLENIHAYNNAYLQPFLEEDFKELQACYEGKAFKATMIMAGSILEAFLIDWVSEEYGKNYFINNCRLIDRRTGRRRDADLYLYIKEVQEIESPRWDEEADKADKIRDMRNIVHAKVCLKNDENINEETCGEIMGYLNDVIKSRGITLGN